MATNNQFQLTNKGSFASSFKNEFQGSGSSGYKLSQFSSSSQQENKTRFLQRNINCNPFKLIAPQPISRRQSDMFSGSETKEMPDTPMIEHKQIAFINNDSWFHSNQRGSNFTTSEYSQNNKPQSSRF